MSEISIYDIVPTPKLADKLIGTSVGGVIEDVTYNFTLQELLQLFIPNIPANTLQGVLDYGNTATQNINLTGTITTTNLSVLATANILNSNLSGNTRVMAGLFDRTNASGTAGQFLRSTGTQVEWFTIPTVIPTLQQVLQSGNTSNISIVLTANITAVTATADTVISNTSLNVNGVLRDGIAAVGASNQILSSTGSGVRWVDMPVYNVISPLLYDTPTKTFSIQVASSSQSGYLSSADWINFDGKQDAIILTTSGTSGAATFVANTLNIPVYSPDLSGYVPTSRTLTINGVSYDLSANRSWTIAAGVASVTATAPLSSSGGANPDISISQSDSSTDGYLSSVDWIDFNSKQDGLNGTGLVKSTAGVITYITDNSTNWNTAYNDSIVSAAVTGTATKTLTLNQQDGGTIQASWSDIDTGLTSVGVSMPSAFSVANSPLTSNGTIAITGAGTSLQYVDGTGALQTFPGLTGFVPYTGATTNVDLGVYSLTASALIKSGGTSSQFLKADGTVDSTSYQPFITAGTTSQYYRGDKTFQTLDTTVVPEGTNLYYLDSRARAALSFAAGSGAYNSTTGVITIPTNTNQLTNGASFITLSSLSAASPLSYNNLTGAFSISQAGASTDGYLSSTDWTTFNAKQVAGNYIVSLTGEATAVGPGAAAVTLNNASVTGKVLTGVNITGGTVLATDTMLTAFGKLQNQINGLIGSTIYQGVWDASTNTPTLTSSVGTNGFYYIVNVAGSTNLNGITDWKIGDWAIFNGGVWQKVDNTESVTSVNGFTGAVSLTTDNIAQGTTNLYFANSLARAAISLTVTGSSGASTYNNTTGVLNVPTYTLSGLGGQPLATNLTSLSGLTFASTSFVKMTAAGTFALDTNTYALSSALANYLPLAGGTLTGALGGTTASFSGAVSTNSPSGGATGEGLVVGQSFKIDGSGTSQRAVMYVVSNVLSDTYGSGLQIQGANLADDKGFGFNLNTTGGFELYVKNTSYNKALTIANTKAATFADTVTATSLIKTGGTSAQFLMADGSVSTGPTGGITGTLTATKVPKATGANTIADSIITDSGTYITVSAAAVDTYIANFINTDPTSSGIYVKADGAAFVTEPLSMVGGITLNANGSASFSGDITANKFIKSGGTSAQFLKADGSVDSTTYGTGTVTSVAALTLGTTGTDLSSTVATGTTTPVITLNVPTASAANRGALSAADWTTFNSKQNALTNPVTGTGTTNYVPKFTGASTIGNSIITDNGTNVAVAGNLQSTRFYNTFVNATSNSRNSFQSFNLNEVTITAGWIAADFGDLGTTSDRVVMGSGYTNKAIIGGHNGVLGAWANLYVNPGGGNLIVGASTDAGYKLQINGTVNARASSTSANLGQPSYLGNGEFMSTGSQAGLFWENRSGGVTSGTNWYGWYTSTGTISLYNGSANLININGTTGAATFSSSVTATSFNLGNGQYLRLTRNSGSLQYDALGIVAGTDNTRLISTGDFDVVNGGLASQFKIASTGAATFSSSVSIGDYLRLTKASSVDIQAYTGSAYTNLNYDAASHNWQTSGGTAKMVLNSSGNVGIGTTAPTAISGFTSLTLNNATNGGIIDFQTNGTGVGRIINDASSFNVLALGASVPLLLGANGSEKMRITSGGNVGIGTTSASSRFNVKGPNSNSQIEFDNFGTGQNFILSYDRVAGAYKDFIITTNANNNALVVTSSGNVGINTTNPVNGRFVVSDTVSNKISIEGGSSQNGMTFQPVGGANAFYLFNGTISSAGWGVYNVSTGAFPIFATNGGNVLIGTTVDAGYRLFTSGQIAMDTGSYKGILGYTTSSWGGSAAFPTLYGSDVTKWIMLINPHISYTQNGVNGYAGAMNGATVRFASDTAATTFWDVGVGICSIGTNQFGIGRGGTILFTIASSNAATFASSVTATSFFESSDATIKTLITDSYQAKGIESVVAKLYTKNGKEELGYYAQDLQGILPSAVIKGTDGLLSLSYREVHTAKISALEKRVAELEQQLNLN